MCNRFRMTASAEELSRRYGFEVRHPEHVDLPPPELFPDKPAYVVRQVDRGRALDVLWLERDPGRARARDGEWLSQQIL